MGEIIAKDKKFDAGRHIFPTTRNSDAESLTDERTAGGSAKKVAVSIAGKG